MLPAFAWEHGAIRQDDQARNKARPRGEDDAGTLQARGSQEALRSGTRSPAVEVVHRLLVAAEVVR